jgi:hypothetical protein
MYIYEYHYISRVQINSQLASSTYIHTYMLTLHTDLFASHIAGDVTQKKNENQGPQKPGVGPKKRARAFVSTTSPITSINSITNSQ